MKKKIAIKRLRKSETLKQSETNLQVQMFAIFVQAHCSNVADCQHDAPKTKAGDDVFLARRLTPTHRFRLFYRTVAKEYNGCA